MMKTSAPTATMLLQFGFRKMNKSNEMWKETQNLLSRIKTSENKKSKLFMAKVQLAFLLTLNNIEPNTRYPERKLF